MNYFIWTEIINCGKIDDTEIIEQLYEYGTKQDTRICEDLDSIIEFIQHNGLEDWYKKWLMNKKT